MEACATVTDEIVDLHDRIFVDRFPGQVKLLLVLFLRDVEQSPTRIVVRSNVLSTAGSPVF